MRPAPLDQDNSPALPHHAQETKEVPPSTHSPTTTDELTRPLPLPHQPGPAQKGDEREVPLSTHSPMTATSREALNTTPPTPQL